MYRRVILCVGVAFSVCCVNLVSAQEDGINSLNRWINEQIPIVVKAKINQGSNSNQTESPAESENSTSLVDQSSAADLIGMALNLSGLSSKENEQGNESLTVTTTAYSLYAAAKGADPLNPVFYQNHRNWRRLSLTLGFDKEEKNDSGETERPKIIGAKILLVNGREAQNHADEITAALKNASLAFGRLTEAMSQYLFMHPQIQEEILKNECSFDARAIDFTDEANWTLPQKQCWVDFRNKYLTANFTTEILPRIGDDGVGQLNELLEKESMVFVELYERTRETVEKIRKAPQLAVSFLATLRNLGQDVYSVEAIFEKGIQGRLNFVLNASYNLKKSDESADDVHQGRIAGELQFQVTRAPTFDAKQSVALDFSAEAKFSSESDEIYKAQAKLVLPIIKGILLPVSLTYSNRTELIDESEVRGEFGFTFDISKLKSLLAF